MTEQLSPPTEPAPAVTASAGTEPGQTCRWGRTGPGAAGELCSFHQTGSGPGSSRCQYKPFFFRFQAPSLVSLPRLPDSSLHQGKEMCCIMELLSVAQERLEMVKNVPCVTGQQGCCTTAPLILL